MTEYYRVNGAQKNGRHTYHVAINGIVTDLVGLSLTDAAAEVEKLIKPGDTYREGNLVFNLRRVSATQTVPKTSRRTRSSMRGKPRSLIHGKNNTNLSYLQGKT